MKKRFTRLLVICMALMIVLGSYTCVSAADYSIIVELDDSKFTGTRVELINSEGSCVNSWELEKKGELVADLPPGSYTLREIVEINGYEMPIQSNIMVGCGTLIPYDPNPETVEPSFDPMEGIDFDDLAPSQLPAYYYDEFQKWIDNQN